MKLTLETAEIYVPDGTAAEEALSRTTHLAVGAHPDDLEIIGYHGILKCFADPDAWFTGIVLTNGSRSPRSGAYQDYTDEQMQGVRRSEQKKAADIGRYGACIMLDYASDVVKNKFTPDPTSDLLFILEKTLPDVVYAHNPADKHETHVAACLRTLAALRGLPRDQRPTYTYGCEGWRDLDWLPDEYKVAFDVSIQPEGQPDLQAALLEVFQSQIAGGKSYDLATLGRRRANATYHASHATDDATSMIYAMDLSPLVKDANLDIKMYVHGHIERFATIVGETLEKFE
jgi:LmbE family N-acetylglucosaminyl deacetylase